jgi:hypothetical protein
MTALGTKLGTRFTGANIKQMQLPLNRGGMGLPNFEEESLVAYIASAIQFMHVAKEDTCSNLNILSLKEEIIPLLKEWQDLLDDSLPPDFQKTPEALLDSLLEYTPKQINKLQEKLTLPLKFRRYNSYINDILPTLTTSDRQAFQLVVNGDSSWLSAMPIGVCKFNDVEFKLAFRGRLRIPLSELQGLPVKTCNCHTSQQTRGIIDNHGDHLMTCKYIKGPDRIVMHDNVVRFLATIDHKARILSEVEPRGKYIATSIKRQPNGTKEIKLLSDLLSHDQNLTSNGLPTLSDISGTHGITSSMDSNDTGGTQHLKNVLEKRAQKKITKYASAVADIDCNFRPLIFETVGGGRHGALNDFIQSRSEIIAQRTGLEAGHIAHRHRVQLTCIIRKDVVRTILNRIERLMVRHYPQSRDQDIYDELNLTLNTGHTS